MKQSDIEKKYWETIISVMKEHQIKYRPGGLSIITAESIALRNKLLTVDEIDRFYGYE